MSHLELSLLENILEVLPEVSRHHSPTDKLYSLFKKIARKEVESSFLKGDIKSLHPFGKINFPYFKMGAIDSLNLFDIDELIIFSFYWINRNRYKNVADLGANIGLHSVLLNKCGYTVRSFEPDPAHFVQIKKNLELNNCDNVEVYNAAVSDHKGEMEFVRVLGNTTSSHLAGSKQNPYGELERFPVKLEEFGSIIEWADLLKIDVEGHEDVIIPKTKREHWEKADAIMEIENRENAQIVFNHLKKLGVNVFAQRCHWQKVEIVDHMPENYKDGSIFISCKDQMLWK